MKELTEEARQMVMDFQTHQQQLQSILMQKENLKLQELEIDKALEELESSNQKTAFKITGSIMVSKPAEEIKSDLKETKEAVSIRIKSLEKNEERITNKLKELQEKLKEVIK